MNLVRIWANGFLKSSRLAQTKTFCFGTFKQHLKRIFLDVGFWACQLFAVHAYSEG